MMTRSKTQGIPAFHTVINVVFLYCTGRELSSGAYTNTDSDTIVDPVGPGSSKRATNNGA
jgi:hypothetical protein